MKQKNSVQKKFSLFLLSISTLTGLTSPVLPDQFTIVPLMSGVLIVIIITIIAIITRGGVMELFFTYKALDKEVNINEKLILGCGIMLMVGSFCSFGVRIVLGF